MTDPEAELKTVVAGLAAGKGSHPSEDDIAAYHAGTLPPDEAALLQDHLVACPECTNLLLSLEDFTREAEPAPAAEIAAAWEGLRARLPVRHSPPAPSLPGPRRSRPSSRRASPWLSALAASLLVAVVGLSFRIPSLMRAEEELSKPQINAPLEDAFASPLRGLPEETVVKLAPEDQRFALVLHAMDQQTFPDFGVEITRADGAAVWQGRGLRRDPDGSFVLTLSRRFTPPGEYRVRLWGIDGPKRELLGEYDVRIEETTGGR